MYLKDITPTKDLEDSLNFGTLAGNGAALHSSCSSGARKPDTGWRVPCSSPGTAYAAIVCLSSYKAIPLATAATTITASASVRIPIAAIAREPATSAFTH